VSGPPRRGANGMGSLPGWADLESAVPQITATMRRYLTQISCVLRPGSVGGADLALRAFAGFLAETAPEVTSTAQVTRRHIEDYKPWLAARPGQNKPRLTTATIAHRLGTLRMFFVRLDEWGWDEAPPRVPMFPGDLPRQDHPLPKALDDASAARLLRAAQNDKRLLVRVTVEMLLRTGLRVSEYTSLRADAVVHIGAGPWLHVPVGKLREDRYLPLHPHLVALIDDYRAAHVAAGNPLLLPRENGKPADRHAVTRYINKAGAAAGLGHIHPHQLRHTLATQAKRRGVASDASFRLRCEAGAVEAAALRASGRGGWQGAGHAAGAGVLVPGCAGWQDAASRSVALGDWLMHLAYAWRDSDGGTAGDAGAGCCGRRGAGFAGCGAAGGDVGGVAVPAAGPQADGATDRRAGAGDPPVQRVHRMLAVAVDGGAGRGVGCVGRVGAFDGPLV
jgi:site-specific recombinase XerD